jgi:zinc protease
MRPTVAADDVRFPKPNGAEPILLYHAGRPDQGISAIAWQTTDVFSDDESAARRLLTDILQMRLMEQLRIADGATYSPQTSATASLTFPGYGYIAAYAEIPPAKSQLFYDTVAKITADLRTTPPSTDEFERARRPELEGLERAEQTNGFWMSGLIGTQTDERRLMLIRQAKPRLERVTPADVQRAAAKYLADQKAWKLVIVPKPRS